MTETRPAPRVGVFFNRVDKTWEVREILNGVTLPYVIATRRTHEQALNAAQDALRQWHLKHDAKAGE